MTAKKPKKAKKPPTEPPKPEPDFLEDPLSVGEQQEEFELATFLQGEGASVSNVKIWRINQGKREFIDECEPDGFSESIIRDTYGPGKYQVILRAPDGTIRAKRIIMIGSRPAGAAPLVPAALQQAAGEESITKLYKEMLDRQNALLVAVLTKERTDSGERASSDPASLLAAITNTFTMLRKETEGPKTNQIDQFKQFLDVVKDISAITGKLPGGGGGEEELTGWGFLRDVALRVADSAMPLLLRGGMVPPGAGPAAQIPESIPFPTSNATVGDGVLALLNQPAPAAAAPAPAGPIFKSNTEWIREGLGYLKAKAAAGKEVEIYIDQLLDNDEEPQWNALIQAIEQGATIEHLVMFDAEIGAAPALRLWFEGLYNGLRRAIDENNNPAGPGGDGGNPAGNAGAGTP